jgi:hypothetical protein
MAHEFFDAMPVNVFEVSPYFIRNGAVQRR